MDDSPKAEKKSKESEAESSKQKSSSRVSIKNNSKQPIAFNRFKVMIAPGATTEVNAFAWKAISTNKTVQMWMDKKMLEVS